MTKQGSDLLQSVIATHAVRLDSGGVAPIKGVAWARVSTEMQERRGLSIPEQLRLIREAAPRYDCEIVDEFSEAASAYQHFERREEFQRMLAFINASPEVSVIFVHDYSRFSRDSVSAQSLLRDLYATGKRVISLNDPEYNLDSPTGTYMNAITLAKNEAYSREIAFHTRKGCRANIHQRDQATGWCYKNGGQPLFGYKTVRLHRGEERPGIPILKSIWELDDEVVNGKAVHEWVRQCLLMTMDGTSLDQLRDFCNENGIPARRRKTWGTSTWNALLQPHILLKYCGYEIYGVHDKKGTIRPSDQWEVEAQAHPGIITPDEAQAIIVARSQRRPSIFDKQNPKRRSSAYLLNGGLFKCAHCGSNMVGYRSNNKDTYYRCGDHEYRKGSSCVACIYIPQHQLEQAVLDGMRGYLHRLTESKDVVRQINDELRTGRVVGRGAEGMQQQLLADIEQQIANLRAAILHGLDDIPWANGELRRLLEEHHEIDAGRTKVKTKPPKATSKTMALCKKHVDTIFSRADREDARALVRAFVQEILFDPTNAHVTVRYAIEGDGQTTTSTIISSPGARSN